MRRELRALALLLTTLLLGAVLAVAGTSATAAEGSPTATPTTTPTATPTEVPGTAFEVDDALLRWGINNESNNRGAAPGTFNFFAAGKLGDPTAGGQVLTDASSGGLWSNGRAAGWKAVDDNVRIQKLQADGKTYDDATWAGTKTDRDGVALGGYAVNTKFSDHQVVLSGGEGEVDPGKGTATIRWTGTFSIVYYSGYTLFTVSDPVLTVAGSSARLTATLGGYSSSMDDLNQWTAVPPRTGVVLADLGKVDLGQVLGFTATPKYRGVKVTGVDQVPGGQYYGSFPQSFIDFQRVAGAAGYWFSSGGSIDRNKVPLDLAVSYAAGKPIIPETSPGTDSPTVQNSAPPPPPTPSRAVQPPGPVLPQQPAVAGPLPVGSAVPVLAGARPVSTVLPAAVAPSAGSADDGIEGPWAAGIVVLLLAGLTGLSPTLFLRARRA